MAKQVDLSTRRAKGLENTLKLDSQREEVEFEFYGITLTTMSQIPAVVIEKVSLLNEEGVTQAQQLEALIYSLKMLIRKDDRKKFQGILEDEGVGLEELFNLLAVLLEELSNTPFEQSTSASNGSKKTSKRSVETL
jgi:hypothetical protein